MSTCASPTVDIADSNTVKKIESYLKVLHTLCYDSLQGVVAKEGLLLEITPRPFYGTWDSGIYRNTCFCLKLENGNSEIITAETSSSPGEFPNKITITCTIHEFILGKQEYLDEVEKNLREIMLELFLTL